MFQKSFPSFYSFLKPLQISLKFGCTPALICPNESVVSGLRDFCLWIRRIEQFLHEVPISQLAYRNGLGDRPARLSHVFSLLREISWSKLLRTQNFQALFWVVFFFYKSLPFYFWSISFRHEGTFEPSLYPLNALPETVNLELNWKFYGIFPFCDENSDFLFFKF